jgi:hypothetical protein
MSNENNTHFNLLRMMQFNILIKLDDNEKECLKELKDKITDIQKNIFKEVGTNCIYTESHQININIAGLFCPIEYIDGSGMFSKEWRDKRRLFWKEDPLNEKKCFKKHYCLDYIKKSLQGIKFSIVFGKINFVQID